MLRALGAIAVSVTFTTVAQADEAIAQLTRGWSTMRTMDCARCHGRDYQGSSAPSLLAAVREAPRERFDRYVLDGDITRGMPGYRSQPAVTANLDAIYAYLLARAKGEIGPGNPSEKR
ncbi:MAG TPA: cytochrome c [Burkholderiaceae bacterium]|nr:cytochrome c [Burkholderiaceae bacterium]